MATCYRHPDRETGVSCSNCGRPICPDCMTPTPVGMRCPECSQQKTQVRNLRSMAVDPIATYILLGINVAIFLGASSSQNAVNEMVLWGPGVADGDYWRLLTSGFLHTSIFHLLMNGLALFWLGRMIEPALGHARFVAIYLVSLLAGSVGVMLLSWDASTLGASGAVYGLLGAAIVMARNRNIPLMDSGLLPILALNLGITFLIPNISIGGHLGGLVGGLLTTFVIEELSRRRRNSLPLAVGFSVAAGAVAIAASVALASNPVL
ncbi:rhomboid family intramembrane serine protease [Solirubrobacter sp. CPCC 204708]|uniref:Rhomboid family intramembrane serine protease n=1 Tax=Solirubrobacter deserti TaxID=2282478 RepID=A0ABT4RNE5_9ACTN|nr:rhomboid family intramembrane serine protease [Solirubrobacter deserti]MBE2318417.1 rhomboid family intramembrane serine protease [Solirubrobacter deserti]MDA0140064.1 rhomboid family intramembrane serine protease [Solirubrobacter deserti]